MTNPLVTVWPHREIPGWNGDPNDLPDLIACKVLPLAEALATVWPTDVHLWPGWVEGPSGPESQSPRINIDALPTLAKLGAGVRFACVFVDADDPVTHGTKAPARDVWRAGFAERVAALPEELQEGLGWYETRGGARLVWWLDEVVTDVADYIRLLVGLRARLRAHGFDRVDEFTDWGRSYRAPKVVRDGKQEARLVKIAALGDLPLSCADLRRSAPMVDEHSSPFDRIGHASLGFELPKVVEEGGRNQTAVKLAGSLRRSGLDEESILIALQAAVTGGRFGEWEPDRGELERIARNIGRKPAGPAPVTPSPSAPSKTSAPTSSSGEDDEPAIKPVIQVKAGGLVQAVGELEAALVPAPIYQRAGEIVTTSRDPSNGYSLRISSLSMHGLRLAAACVADWQSWKSAKKPGKGEPLPASDPDLGEWVPTDPPIPVIQALEAKGSWALRPLVGVTEVPPMRPDGSLHTSAGYDEGTGYLFDPGKLNYPPVPESPTWAQARAALDELIEPIAEFDFQTPADRSVALAGFIAAVIRPALDKVPLTILDGHTPGSGKTTQAQIAAILATGREVPVVSETGEEEVEIRITALLSMGEPVTLIDNVTRPVGGGALDALLTGREWRGRRLGQTEMVTIPNRTNLFVSGNNVTVKGDLYRRTLRSYLDVQDESPEHRTDFKIKDLLTWVTEHRGRLVAAALTVVRGYVCSVERGRNQPGPLQSFGAWSRLVREPLIWLGEDDPVKTQQALRRIADLGLVSFEELLGAWLGYFGEKSVTVSEALEELPQKRGNLAAVRLIHAIEEITALPIGDRKTGSKIGYEIRTRKNRAISGLFFTQGDETRLGRRWKIAKKHDREEKHVFSETELTSQSTKTTRKE